MATRNTHHALAIFLLDLWSTFQLVLVEIGVARIFAGDSAERLTGSCQGWAPRRAVRAGGGAGGGGPGSWAGRAPPLQLPPPLCLRRSVFARRVALCSVLASLPCCRAVCRSCHKLMENESLDNQEDEAMDEASVAGLLALGLRCGAHPEFAMAEAESVRQSQ